MLYKNYQAWSPGGFFLKIVDTLVNGVPSPFHIDRVHQVENSLSHALLVYYLVYVSTTQLIFTLLKPRPPLLFTYKTKTRILIFIGVIFLYYPT
jgi:hypothetical protein